MMKSERWNTEAGYGCLSDNVSDGELAADYWRVADYLGLFGTVIFFGGGTDDQYLFVVWYFNIGCCLFYRGTE